MSGDYVEFGSIATAQGPLDCQGTRLWAFWVEGDRDRISHLCDRVFEAPVVFEMAAEGDHPRMAIVDLGAGAALNIFEVDEASIIDSMPRVSATACARLVADTWSTVVMPPCSTGGPSPFAEP